MKHKILPSWREGSENKYLVFRHHEWEKRRKGRCKYQALAGGEEQGEGEKKRANSGEKWEGGRTCSGNKRERVEGSHLVHAQERKSRNQPSLLGSLGARLLQVKCFFSGRGGKEEERQEFSPLAPAGEGERALPTVAEEVDKRQSGDLRVSIGKVAPLLGRKREEITLKSNCPGTFQEEKKKGTEPSTLRSKRPE